MRIAQIVCTYPPYYGGMGNVVFQTAGELVKLGHEVEVLTPQYYESKEVKSVEAEAEEEHAEDLTKQIDYARRLKPAFSYGNAAYLPQLSGELNDFDIVHLHYPFFGVANLVRRWKLKNPQKPLVITYHMDTRAPGWKGLFFKYYSRYWLSKILQSADKLIVSSFDYLQSSQAGDIYKLQPDKWQELPFGVDGERFQPRSKPEKLLAQLGFDYKLPTILFVGGMDEAHYFKGIPVLLGALKQLKDKNFFVQTVLVGEGSLKNDFKNQARFLGLADRVKFVGQVSDEDLPFFYNLADLFVLPSLNQAEAFGMVLLEAFASGVPVIASDLPGVRSVAIDGGLVVPANNQTALAEVIQGYFSDSVNMVQMKKQVRLVAKKKYFWQPIAKELESTYQQLLRAK